MSIEYFDENNNSNKRIDDIELNDYGFCDTNIDYLSYLNKNCYKSFSQKSLYVLHINKQLYL